MSRTVTHGACSRGARRGQVWSSDFTMSLLIFTIASLIAFTMIVNTIDERDFEEVRMQASSAAALLAGEGYPAHWTNDTVIRAGLLADERLSLRKAAELAKLEDHDLRMVLRTTDDTYVYFTNASNDTAPVFGACGVGSAAATSTALNQTLPALAIVGASHPVSDLLPIAQRSDDALYDNMTQDVIIIEDSISSNLSDAEIKRIFDDIAERGMTFVVLGDPGIPILGIDVNSSDASLLTVAEGGELLLLPGEELTVSGTIPTINVPAGEPINNYQEIAVSDAGSVAYATWTYHDARIWYLATTAGTHADGRDLRSTLVNATRDMITVPRPACGPVLLPDAEQVAVHTRTLAHHDELLHMHVLVWRE